MGGSESTIIEIIWNFGGEASVSTIAKEARMTPDYVRLICEGLGRHDYIDFRGGKKCYLRGKGKLEAAKMKVRGNGRRKIVVPDTPAVFGFGKDKKGHITLKY